MCEPTAGYWHDLIADDELMTALLADESFWRELVTTSDDNQWRAVLTDAIRRFGWETFQSMQAADQARRAH